MTFQQYSRVERRALAKISRKLNMERPISLTEIPREQWGDCSHLRTVPSRTWVSRKYLVQLFEQADGAQRMSICRTTLDESGHWEDGLTWEELQQIKAEVGFGSAWAVEIYPPEDDVVNVANMRHLWLLSAPLQFGWKA